MSWFDTTKLATIANKAMKEAQKTLDSALDIAEEQAEAEGSPALWAAWRTPGLPKVGQGHPCGGYLYSLIYPPIHPYKFRELSLHDFIRKQSLRISK
jgi:hypothetical protein